MDADGGAVPEVYDVGGDGYVRWFTGGFAWQLDPETGSVSPLSTGEATLLFDGPNCTGASYVSPVLPLEVIELPDGGAIARPIGLASREVAISSRWYSGEGGACSSTGGFMMRVVPVGSFLAAGPAPHFARPTPLHLEVR
ncbi:MAG: hypothetical protein IPJ65_35435 [Archangiaceae bacterium]|nr:hypothetical protein [Archangiaceae bacterium]